MIYKTLKKVSNVCQLLDKSKYPSTKTVNGVTFTNNGDGTITANGTATGRAALVLFIKTLPIIRGKGLVIGDPQPSYAFINYTFYNNKDNWIADNASFEGNGVIFTGRDDAVSAELYIAIEGGHTANNLVFKPQLFDLTEMYGAGNEPTTVEQFRQDFPEELYDYKPYCFVKSYKTLLKASNNKIITSYKKSLVCKTKNLFDILDVQIRNTGVLVDNNTVYAGDISIDAATLVVFSKTYAAGTYTITRGNTYGGCTNVRLLLSIRPDSTFAYNNYYKMYFKDFTTVTFTASESFTMGFVLLGSGAGGVYNIQLELGDTATDYVPYGHL